MLDLKSVCKDKMIYIAHRANIDGPNPDLENSPKYIEKALEKGFFVEIDVWFFDDEIFLGHDFPEYKTTLDFIDNPKIFCHAKTPQTLEYLIENNVHCFSHDQDECVLTSRNYIWTFPGKKLTSKSICVMPERYIDLDTELQSNDQIKNCFGICSDFVEKIQILI
jgi:hypothetical protein